RSLRRLRVERLDCYLLHWPGDHPLAGTVEAFEELAAAGKIGAWGVSNFDEQEVDRVLGLARPGRCACDQVLYHLQERAIEHAVLHFCAERGIAVVAYSPFSAGRFPHRDTRGGRVLAELAAAHGATPHQVALAFLLRRGVFVIPKSSSAAHVEENAAAA